MLGPATKLRGRGLGGTLLNPVSFQTTVATEIVVSTALFFFGAHRTMLGLTEVQGHRRGGSWHGGDKRTWGGLGSGTTGGGYSDCRGAYRLFLQEITILAGVNFNGQVRELGELSRFFLARHGFLNSFLKADTVLGDLSSVVPFGVGDQLNELVGVIQRRTLLLQGAKLRLGHNVCVSDPKILCHDRPELIDAVKNWGSFVNIQLEGRDMLFHILVGRCVPKKGDGEHDLG